MISLTNSVNGKLVSKLILFGILKSIEIHLAPFSPAAIVLLLLLLHNVLNSKNQLVPLDIHVLTDIHTYIHLPNDNVILMPGGNIILDRITSSDKTDCRITYSFPHDFLYFCFSFLKIYAAQMFYIQLTA